MPKRAPSAASRVQIAWKALTEIVQETPEVADAWGQWHSAHSFLMTKLREDRVLMNAWRTWLLAEADAFLSEEKTE